MGASGEYATWKGIGPEDGGSVLLVMELIEDMNLNQLTGQFFALMSSADYVNKCKECGHGETNELRDLLGST